MIGAAIAVLSTENLVHNAKILKALAPQSRILGMVKANAYGHGLRSVAQRLEPYVYSFGVARIDEAIALRQAGIKLPITLIEGIFSPDELLVAACQNFHVVFHNNVQLQWLQHSNLPRPLTAWIKVNTGMNRLGFPINQVRDAYRILSTHRLIEQPVGVMSHLACSEDPAHPLTRQQLADFTELASTLPGPKSLANSAALLGIPSSYYEVIRPGLALYGLSPIPGITSASLGLKPVMTLQTRVIAIHNIHKGESIGYGARFTCPQDMKIGVIAMGYGDGYSRTVRDGTPVLVNGVSCNIVGRVSMDMSTIDLSQCKEAAIGDSVTLWGEGLPLEEVAAFTDHSVYDLICGVQHRVKYHWTMA